MTWGKPAQRARLRLAIVHDFRRRRGWVSTWLIAAMLFMQLAVAAHACPQFAPVEQAAMADMPDCPHHRAAVAERDGTTLCKAHCEAGLQSVNSQAGALDAPPVLALPAALVGTVDATAVGHAERMPGGLAAGPPAGAPPLYLTFLVLRN